MHICRIRYTVLGLLVYYLQSVFVASSSNTCVSDFDDVASKTVMADVVFEGQYYRELPVKERPGFSNVRFNKIVIIKGTLPEEQQQQQQQQQQLQLQQQQQNSASRGQRRDDSARRQSHAQLHGYYHNNHVNNNKNNAGRLVSNPAKRGDLRDLSAPILVGQFGPAHEQSDCVYARKSMVRGQRYLVFLSLPESNSESIDSRSGKQRDSSKAARDRRQKAVSTQQQHPVVYRMSSFPVATSSSLKKEAANHSCQNCGKIPKIAKLTKAQNVTEGRRLKVTCRSTGFPKPEIYWLRNGILLEKDNDVSIKNRKLSSVLVVKDVKDEDTGQYQCYAINVLGQSNLSSVFVTVLSKTKKPFSERCQDQGYCVNSGICYKLLMREHYFCQCKEDFIGERCEEKNTGYMALMGRKKKRSVNRRHHRRLIHPRMHLI